MITAIRSELLRSVSGLSLWAVYLLTIMVPVAVFSPNDSLAVIDEADPGMATARLLAPLAWSFVYAGFIGAYAVTREYYYDSMDRTLVELGFLRAFWGKLIAGSIMAMVLAICMFCIWTIVAFFILNQHGLPLTLTAEVWRIYGGALLGVFLGAIIGGAIGWITRNYYLGAIIVLAFPLAIEFAWLGSSPGVAKFSLGLSLAALSVPGFKNELLEMAPAMGIACVWAAGLVVLAWFLGRRRVS